MQQSRWGYSSIVLGGVAYGLVAMSFLVLFDVQTAALAMVAIAFVVTSIALPGIAPTIADRVSTWWDRRRGRLIYDEHLQAWVRPEHREALRLLEFQVTPKGWHASLEGSDAEAKAAVEAFVADVGQYFVMYGGQNYLEVTVYHPELGPMIVSFQRVHGKTPNQLKQEAEHALAALRQRVIDAGHAALLDN